MAILFLLLTFDVHTNFGQRFHHVLDTARVRLPSRVLPTHLPEHFGESDAPVALYLVQLTTSQPQLPPKGCNLIVSFKT